MNVEQLKKNVGSVVKVRPTAIRQDSVTGEILPEIDDNWMIDRVGDGKVSLRNLSTDHVVDLGNDSVREYRTSGHLLLRCQLTLSGNRAHVEPITGDGPYGRPATPPALRIELPPPVNRVGYRSPPYMRSWAVKIRLIAPEAPLSILELGVYEPGVGEWKIEERFYEGGRRLELPLRVEGAAEFWIRAYAPPSEPRVVNEFVLWFRDHLQGPAKRHEHKVSPPPM